MRVWLEEANVECWKNFHIRWEIQLICTSSDFCQDFKWSGFLIIQVAILSCCPKIFSYLAIVGLLISNSDRVFYVDRNILYDVVVLLSYFLVIYYVVDS